MKVLQLIAWVFGKSRPVKQPEPPKQVEFHKLSFRPTQGNGTRAFRSRPVRGNAA